MFSKSRRFALLIVAVGLTSSVNGQEFTDTVDRYVTRMEKRAKLAYEPRVQLEEKTISRGSWIPFRSSKGTEKKLVPVVRWVPRWTEETLPVTEKLTMKSPRRTASQVATRSSGNLSIGRPTPTIQPRPIVTNKASAFGGVQRLSDDMPRMGMRLRDLR